MLIFGTKSKGEQNSAKRTGRVQSGNRRVYGANPLAWCAVIAANPPEGLLRGAARLFGMHTR